MMQANFLVQLMVCIVVLTLASCKERSDSNSLAAAPLPGPASESTSPLLTVDTLRRIIADHGITTIDNLLARLPNSYLTFYTLMHASKSRQGSTGTDPRAIVFGSDARMIMTFNGAPAQSGYKTLEVMQFNDSAREFELYEISFPEAQGAVTFSAKNPNKCIGCHQSPPRPNWEPYFSWPGAFGSEDDGSLVGSEEIHQTSAFVASYLSRNRYRNLPNAASHYAVAFTAPSRLQPDKNLAVYSSKPNLALTLMLFKLNVQRIGKLLMAQDAFRRNKFLATSILSGCLPGYDPSTPNLNMPTQEYSQLSKLEPRLALLKDALEHLNPEDVSQDVVLSGAAGMLSIANNKLHLGLNVNLANWATSFLGPDPKALGGFASAPFNDGSSDVDVSLYITAASISTLDPDFAGLDDFICPDPGEQANVEDKIVFAQHFCPDLRARQQELTAKHGFFEPDGHKMTCKVIAQRWLRTLRRSD